MITAAALALGLAVAAEGPPQACPPPSCPPCPPCAPPAPPPRKPWTGSVGLGLVAITGNGRSLSLAGNAAAERKGERFIFGVRAAGAYGEARPAGQDASQVSALNASLFLRADYRLTPPLSVYAIAGGETDHVKSIEIRYTEELGLGYAWIDRKVEDRVLYLRTDLGFRLAEEYRFQYYPTPGPVDPREFTLKAPRVGAAFRYGITRDVLITEDVEVLPNVDESRLLVNSLSKLAVKLASALQLGIGFTVNYDGAPPSPKIPWDTTLALTLDYLL
jgi:putative salt-induced outer membrane protein YdiY